MKSKGFLHPGRMAAMIFFIIGCACLYNAYNAEILIVDGALEPMDYPKALLFIWMCLSVIYFLSSTGKKQIDNATLIKSFPQILKALISTIVFIFLLKTCGFICSAVPYIASFFYLFGRKDHLKILSIGIFSTLILWLLFEKVLVMNLPLGIWENIFF